MSDIIRRVTLELQRWAFMTGLTAVIISWTGLFLTLGWSVRVVKSAQISLFGRYRLAYGIWSLKTVDFRLDPHRDRPLPPPEILDGL